MNGCNGSATPTFLKKFGWQFIEKQSQNVQVRASLFVLNSILTFTAPKLWSEYTSFLLSKYEESHDAPFTYDKILETFQKGYDVIKYNIPESHILWNQYRDFLLLELEMPSKKAAAISNIKRLYQQRLEIPHKTLEDTFSSYSTFISSYDNANYENVLVPANKVYQQTHQVLALRDSWELALAEARSLDNYAAYIFWEITRPKKQQEPHLVAALYERAIIDFPLIAEIWDDYLYYVAEKLGTDALVCNIINRSLLACPHSGILWAHKLRFSLQSNADEDQLFDLKETFDNIKVFREPEKYTDWKAFATEWICHLGKTVEKDVESLDIKVIESVLGDCEDALDRIQNEGKGDVNFDLEVVIMEIFRNLSYGDRWSDLKKTRGNQANYWIQRVDWELRSSTVDHEKVRGILLEAVSRVKLDWSEKVHEKNIQFERLYGTASGIQQALAKSRIQSKIAQSRRQEQYQTHEVAVPEQPSSKRSHDELEEDSTTAPVTEAARPESKTAKLQHQQKSRDREHNTVVVSGFAESTTDADLQKFFKACGEVVSINIGENRVATLEFADNISALSALTRDMKKIKGNEISVKSGQSTTLYVTNFPPEYTEDNIRKLFSQYGQILSIRFPSLKFNAHRRFCYVQFASNESASTAAASLNGEQAGDFTLQVLISDPSKKSSRQGALYEDREVFVKGLDFNSVDENELRSVLGLYGKIERVRLPLSRSNEKQGRLHDGFGFVVFSTASEAEAASKSLDGTKLASRTLHVSLASKRNNGPKTRSKLVLDGSTSETSPGAANINARTLTISNLTDTINDSQLKTIFEKYGPLKQILLRPDLNGAKVEYLNVADAGKAELALQGQVIAGKAIRIGGSNLGESSNAPSGLPFLPRTMRNRQKRL